MEKSCREVSGKEPKAEILKETTGAKEKVMSLKPPKSKIVSLVPR